MSHFICQNVIQPLIFLKTSESPEDANCLQANVYNLVLWVLVLNTNLQVLPTLLTIRDRLVTHLHTGVKCQRCFCILKVKLNFKIAYNQIFGEYSNLLICSNKKTWAGIKTWGGSYDTSHTTPRIWIWWATLTLLVDLIGNYCQNMFWMWGATIQFNSIMLKNICFGSGWFPKGRVGKSV